VAFRWPLAGQGLWEVFPDSVGGQARPSGEKVLFNCLCPRGHRRAEASPVKKFDELRFRFVFGAGLMACGGCGAVPTAVLGPLSARPAVVLAYTRHRAARSAAVRDPSKLLFQGADPGQCRHELGGDCFYVGNELGVRACEVGDCRSIGGSRRCQVCDVINGFGLVRVKRVGVETSSAGANVECVVILLVCKGKIDFELRPRFGRRCATLPDFAIVGKYAGAEHELVRRVDNLGRGIRCLAGSSKLGLGLPPSICLYMTSIG
jgi:hypothetical protein